MMDRNLNRPTLPLLPDLEGETSLAEGLGLQAAGEDFLSVLARNMDASGEVISADVLGGVRRSARAVNARQEEGAWRGLLATVLLWDTWAENARDGALLNVTEVAPDTAFAAMVLSARRPCDRREPLCLATISRNGRRAALGLAHRALGIVPAATATDLSDMLPGRVRWYDRSACAFTDPVRLLNERDRVTLIHRLSLFTGDAAKRFASALGQEGLRISRAVAAQEADALADLSVRALAVCGLEGFHGLECREETYADDPAGNPLLRALGLSAPALHESFQPQKIWLWQGKPFARSSASVGFEPACAPEETQTLAAAAAECALLTASASWQRDMGRRLNEWLMQHGHGRGFSPAARDQLKEMQRQAEAAGRQLQEQVTLQWPWAEESGAAAYLVQELLGEAFVSGGRAPFSDKLTLLPDAAPDALGDPTLCISCALPMEETGMLTMALPPLSPDMAKCAAQQPECLKAEAFSMTVTELGAVQASFTVQGKAGRLTFTRLYDETDIVLLQPEDTPTVAVWPSVAFPAEAWKAYHVYTHGHGLTVSALREGAWVCDDEHLWSVVRTETFPACLTVHRDGLCLGALLNQLPVFRADPAEGATAAIDLGMSGTSVALRQGERVYPMQLPCLVRTLLHGSRPAPFEEEFLPAEPIGGMLPSAAAMFRDVAAPLPLVDGHTGSAEQLDYVRTSLKWSAEGPERKACLLHLRQTMLTASLCAKLNGARDMAWRVALPADLSPARRSALAEAVRTLAPVVAKESCLPLTVTQAAVCCVDADQAMTAYMKSSGYQRGGFQSMDVGSSGVSMMLWLRGMNRPCAVTHLPMGVHGMLLHALMRQPEALEADFAGMQDQAAGQAVAALCMQLRSAQGSRRAFGRCMLLLDELLEKHMPALQEAMNQAMAQGGMTLMQSLLLCGMAWLMTTAGLQLERAWQDATVNDHLPQELPLCLAGRGSLLLTGMPDTLKLRLTRFMRLGMSSSNRVCQVYVTVPAAPKAEMALGALRTMEGVAELAADVPPLQDTALPVSPLMLLKRFLTVFAAEFPVAAQRLWPDMMQDGAFTEEAELRLQSLVQMHPEASPAAMALCLQDFSCAK